jgi:hypothetical protein
MTRAAALRPLQPAGNRALARAVFARRAVATPCGMGMPGGGTWTVVDPA